jgi:hypothetical protein
MRVKNKEIKARRHRKEQKIKDAQREIRALYADKKDAPPNPAPTKAAAKPAAKKAAPAKKKADAE